MTREEILKLIHPRYALKEGELDSIYILANSKQEEWKHVAGYEGRYMISSFGRVKSLKKDQIMVKSPNNKGYIYVGLSRKSKKKQISIHRLVAIHFIDNPLSKPFVNHKYGLTLNNYWWALEWSTASENTKHAFDNNLKVVSDNQRKAVTQSNRMRSGSRHAGAIKVMDKITGHVYNSVKDAALENGINVYSLHDKLKGKTANTTNLIYAK
jgi:hypothetical protein